MNSGSQSLTVGGRRLVAGLLWQPLQRPRSYMEEARQIGKQFKMDVVAIRRTSKVMQAGFAQRGMTKKGDFSLAAVVASVVGADAIVVCPAGLDDDRFVVVGVHEGSIVPGYDVIASRDEAEQLLRGGYTEFSFNRVICPADWGFGGDELTLAELVPASACRPEHRLRPLTSGVSVGHAAAVLGTLCVLGGAVGGWFWYQGYVEEQEEAKRAAIAAALAASQPDPAMDAATAAVVQALRHPWIDKPRASDMVAACRAVIHDVPLSVGGWLVDIAECSNGQVTAQYVRGVGRTAEGLRLQAAAYGWSVAMIDDAGDRASLARPIAMLAPGGDDATVPMAEAVERVKTLMQHRRTNFSLAPLPFVPPPQPDPNVPAPQPDWQTYSLTIVDKQTPELSLHEVLELPVYRVTSMVARRNGSALEWSVMGELYGR